MQWNYGCLHDFRDHRDVIRTYVTGEIPYTKYDLVKYISHVYNQGGLDSCRSNVLSSANGLELM